MRSHPCLREVLVGGTPACSGIVDEDVNLRLPLFDEGRYLVAACFRRQIRHDVLAGAWALLIQLVAHLLQLLFFAGSDVHLCPVLHERRCNHLAYAGPSPGHDRDFAAHIEEGGDAQNLGHGTHCLLT